MNWGWVQKDRKVGASRLVHALEISTDLELDIIGEWLKIGRIEGSGHVWVRGWLTK